MKIHHLINIVYDSNKSKSNLLLLLDDLDRSDNKLYIIDKSESAWVKDFLNDKLCKIEKITIIRSGAEFGLLESIKKWALETDLDDSDFVQVYAEDDLYMRIGQNVEIKDSSVLMFITPIVFLYDRDVVVENQNEYKGLADSDKLIEIFKNTQTVGDSSWHSLIRADVFKIYWKWIDSLPLVLWNVSNQAIWTALYFGKISRLNSFIFIKDSESWAEGHKTKKRMLAQYEKLFGDGSLYVYDSKLYYIGCLANLFWLDINNNLGINRKTLRFLIKNICHRPSIRNAYILFIRGNYWKEWINYLKIRGSLSAERISYALFGVELLKKVFVMKIFESQLSLLPKEFIGLVNYYRLVSEKWGRA